MAKVVAVLKRRGADLLCLALIAGLASGCHTVQHVPPSMAGARQLVGTNDKVRIITRDGVQLSLVVGAITNDGVVGYPPDAGAAPITVPFSRIATMDRVEYSETRTIGAAAGGAAILMAISAIAFVVLFWKLESAGPYGPGQQAAPGQRSLPAAP